MDGQLATFVITIVTGAVLGLLFDFYRVVRRSLQLRWAATALADLAYWLLATVIVFAGLLAGNGGEIRLYVFFGLAVGLFGYYRLCSRWTVRLLTAAARLVARVARTLRLALLCVFIKPLRFFGRQAVRPLRYIGGRLSFRRSPPPEDGPPI